MSVSSNDVRALLTKWCDSQQELYVVFFEPRGMQALTGKVTGVGDSAATVSDSVVKLRLPIGEPMDAFFTFRSGAVHSVTITWPDGTCAFVVSR